MQLHKQHYTARDATEYKAPTQSARNQSRQVHSLAMIMSPKAAEIRWHRAEQRL